MPRLVNSPPKYRLHRSSGRAFVVLDGRRVYLGDHGTAESRRQYDATVARWLVQGRQLVLAGAASATFTVAELAAEFWKHAEGHYRHSDGSPTGEVASFRAALRPLVELYGPTCAAGFGPLSLRAVRERLIAGGLARPSVNAHIGRIRRVFRWGAGRELVPASVWDSLRCVEALAAGRCTAPEPAPITPVTEREIEATIPHLSTVAAAIVRFMYWSGCRPAEACALRGRGLDRTGRVWRYKPVTHKCAWRGMTRTIMVGPQAQKVLAPFLRLDADAPIFDAADELRERSERRRAARETPLWPGHLRHQARKRARATKDAFASRCYTQSALRRAINRACAKASIPAWAPNRLRHACATRLRSAVGLEAAALILGHAGGSEVTLCYAERDERKAAELAERLG